MKDVNSTDKVHFFNSTHLWKVRPNHAAQMSSFQTNKTVNMKITFNIMTEF